MYETHLSMAWSTSCVSKCIFKFVCILATIAFVGKGIHQYLLDEDAIVIKNAFYFDTDDDVVPILSFCFKQSFDTKPFVKNGSNVTGRQYDKYLRGEYFDEAATRINYDHVSTNLSKYLISYAARYQNGSWVEGIMSTLSWKKPYPTITFNQWGKLFKCFGLEITDKNVNGVWIFLDRSIFPNRTRPEVGGFATLLHYPNQTSLSLSTLMWEWKQRGVNSNYWITLDIKAMEVVKNRYKSKLDNCVENWKNYDDIVQNKRINTVGCKTPYQRRNPETPICATKEDFEKAGPHLGLNAMYHRPCREVVSIDYHVMENENEESEYLTAWGKNSTQYFAIGLRFLNTRFKETITKKALSFESLIGYLGGYFGLFIGLSITQIPGIALGMFHTLDNIIVRITHKKESNSNELPSFQ